MDISYVLNFLLHVVCLTPVTLKLHIYIFGLICVYLSVGQTVLKANTWIYVEKEDPTPRINIKVLQSMVRRGFLLLLD